MTEAETEALLDVLAWDSSDPPTDDRWTWGDEPAALISRLHLGSVRDLYGSPVMPLAST